MSPLPASWSCSKKYGDPRGCNSALWRCEFANRKHFSDMISALDYLNDLTCSSVVVESEKNVNHHHTFAVPVSISCYHGMASIKACVCTKTISLCCVFITKTRSHSEKVSLNADIHSCHTEFLTFDLCFSVEHSKNLQDQLKHLLKWPIETKVVFLFQWCKCYMENNDEISSWLLITMLCKYICGI